jgi:Glycosyltransferase family 10 (fucosyltransferase) C-term
MARPFRRLIRSNGNYTGIEMSSLTFTLTRLYYKRLDKLLNRYRKFREKRYRKEYASRYSAKGKIKVCTYQSGFSRHFTRYFTSSDAQDHPFYLVADPQHADVVAFINTIDDTVLRRDQHAILFFHEPQDYAHKYQSEIHEERLPRANLEVVSHLPSPALFIKNPDGVHYHRSIPYVHFHHGATWDQLHAIDEASRNRLICCITSGLSGDIPGYLNRRAFLGSFSAACPDFDLFGRFSQFSAGIPSYRGQCVSKWKTVSRYKYSLVIENSTDDYYISEKIFDALICGSMPIYHGSDRIFEILPKEWFYYLPSLDNSEIGKLKVFLATDAYKAVSANRSDICETVYKRFSFYSALEHLLANEPLPVVAR